MSDFRIDRSDPQVLRFDYRGSRGMSPEVTDRLFEDLRDELSSGEARVVRLDFNDMAVFRLRQVERMTRFNRECRRLMAEKCRLMVMVIHSATVRGGAKAGFAIAPGDHPVRIFADRASADRCCAAFLGQQAASGEGAPAATRPGSSWGSYSAL